MEKLNPEAPAESGDFHLNSRNDVQAVDSDMIFDYIRKINALPPESALPFSEWLHEVWYDFNEDGDFKVGEVIEGALKHWRGE